MTMFVRLTPRHVPRAARWSMRRRTQESDTPSDAAKSPFAKRPHTASRPSTSSSSPTFVVKERAQSTPRAAL